MNLADLLGSVTISIPDLLINLGIGGVLAFGLALYYMKFGRTLSNRSHLARVLPIIALTTLLVIAIVKSSLALSLGLVGALSIVRFRTPIKEPEELAYLFLAIGIGLGLGADQRLAVIVALPSILAIMLIPNLVGRGLTRRNTFMRVEIPDITNAKETFGHLINELSTHVRHADLRRIDLNENVLDATLYISSRDDREIVALMDGIRERYSNASITFVEQDGSYQV